MNKARVVLILLILLVLGYGIAQYENQPAHVPDAVVATVAPELESAVKTDIPIKTIKAYAPKTKAALNLPKAVQSDNSLQVIAASKVKASEHAQTVTTVVNTDTGETQTFVKDDPLPWVALSFRGEAGMYYGIKNGVPTVRLEARQDLLQVKSTHIQATAALDQSASRTDSFIGLGAVYRW